MIDNITDLVSAMPDMLSQNELISAMAVLPEYDENIISSNNTVRLLALTELYKIYIPSKMSSEIYEKLYIALMRSLQKKGTKIAIRQQNENYKAIHQQEYEGIIGGSDSFTIIGISGIGKSSAISRAISLITNDMIIIVDKPFVKIIPCVIVQCPFDSSVKGLLLEILRKVDEHIETKYYDSALRSRSTTDMLIGSVSQVALNHIGMLIVDEIQNVVNSKNGKSLVGMLTQLINNSGISICMVGTPESTIFFEQAMQLARRSVGLQYGALPYDSYFEEVCKLLLSYRYVRYPTEISPSLINWLFEHSRGIIAILISIIHDAQEIAILNASESLNIITLDEAYKKRLTLMHGFLHKESVKCTQPAKKRSAWNVPVSNTTPSDNQISILEIVQKAKNENLDIIELMKIHNLIEEVAI